MTNLEVSIYMYNYVLRGITQATMVCKQAFMQVTSSQIDVLTKAEL